MSVNPVKYRLAITDNKREVLYDEAGIAIGTKPLYIRQLSMNSKKFIVPSQNNTLYCSWKSLIPFSEFWYKLIRHIHWIKSFYRTKH